MQGRSAAKAVFSVLFAIIASLVVFGATASSASAETRTLNIHFVHTNEKASITFKRNGRYDAKGLKQLNNIVRDWRRNEPTKMDPRLFDLVWEVYKRAGASGYIKVVSGYRSPQTNAMLRSRSKGVAKESQHMRGTAMDFYIPGVPLKTLREIGMKLQAGGVGYYPNSGSPFVHMDVASVRAWPRMSRQELVRLFPDGKTIHVPSDGKPLPGYQQAMAEYKRRLSSNQIIVADSKSPSKSKNLLALLFGGGGDEDEEEDVVPAERPSVASQPAAAPQPPPVQPIVTAAPAETMVAAVNAPVPQSRPSLRPGDNSLAVALYSPARSAAEDALSQVAAGQPTDNENFADLQTFQIPVPTLLGARGMKGDADPEVLTASVAPEALTPDAEDMAGIPVPAGRPAVAEALLASADIANESDIDEVEQAILSPEAAEALAQAETDRIEAPLPAETDVAQLPASVATPLPQPTPSLAAVTPVAKPALEVAALAPPAPASRTVDFGDVFDTPKPVAAGPESGLPAKGGRPTQAEAEAARMAMYGGTSLTKDMISDWALNKKSFDTVTKPGKAPRIVSRSLNAEPAGVYAVGFKGGNATIDPARFGGPAPVTQ